eukprot:TRINITY_DN5185_c0_g2_i2.p5 TRINITY_DN5185_c0_g2~~TRINITY_DN5185_c0_g2_i2.p5  ORF type:complete len:195 (-),score=0.50 TRINITY_DN5185_c0_g2_i2:6-590(-)
MYISLPVVLMLASVSVKDKDFHFAKIGYLKSLQIFVFLSSLYSAICLKASKQLVCKGAFLQIQVNLYRQSEYQYRLQIPEISQAGMSVKTLRNLRFHGYQEKYLQSIVQHGKIRISISKKTPRKKKNLCWLHFKRNTQTSMLQAIFFFAFRSSIIHKVFKIKSIQNKKSIGYKVKVITRKIAIDMWFLQYLVII